MKEKNNPMYGKNHSNETKEKMSVKKIGKKASIETKEKMSAQRQGKNNANYHKLLPELINSIINDYNNGDCVYKISLKYALNRGKINRLLKEYTVE